MTCERCQKNKKVLWIPTGFAGESEPLCADCIFADRNELEDKLEKATAVRALAEGQSSSAPEMGRKIVQKVKLEEIKGYAAPPIALAGRKCLIWAGDGGAYWLANGCGYGGKSDAGIYDFDDAFRRSRHCGPEKHIEYHFLKQAQRGDEQGERDGD